MQILKMMGCRHRCITTVVGLLLCVLSCAMLPEIYLDKPTDLADACKHDQGKLLSYDDMLNSEELIKETLEVDKSVRLSGVARFSPYITFTSCFYMTDYDIAEFKSYFVYAIKMQNERIFINCVSSCSRRNKLYVGIMSRGCYCFGERMMGYVRTSNIVTECTKSRTALLNNTRPDLNENNMIIYSLVGNNQNTRELNDVVLPYFMQCQFMKRILYTSKLDYIKHACPWKDVSGFICDIPSVTNICTDSYAQIVKLKSNRTLCIVNKPLPLVDAITYCVNNKGNLASSDIDENAVELAVDLAENAVYLLGEFREFHVYQSNDRECITVRKSADILLVETYENCSNIPSLCSRTVVNSSTESNTLTIIIGMSMGYIILIVIIVILVVILVVKLREQRSCHQPTRETNAVVQNDGDRTRTNPLFGENTSPEYADADPYSNVDMNKQETSGNDKHYDLVQEASALSMPNQHSNIYLTPIGDTSDKSGQHMTAGATRTSDSDMYLHMSSDSKGDEYITCV